MRIWHFAVIIIFISGCNNPSQSLQSNSQENVDLKSALPGVWEAISFRVNINGADSSVTPSVFEVAESDWVEKLNIRPIITYYDTTNKFRSEYKNQSDSLVGLTRGIWNTFGDTLMLIAPDATYQYKVTMQNGKAEFRCLLDWDGDGLEDDEYIGIQKYVKKP
ncbi:MAG: hypothetical protein IPJ74_05455 [Saprospiraceae bacterium]|nr:hypothetical protein [Saprospiraceae bacterium]